MHCSVVHAVGFRTGRADLLVFGFSIVYVIAVVIEFVKYEKYSLSKDPCSILSHRALTVPIMQYL